MEERRSAWYTLFAHALKSPQDVGTPNYSVIHIHCTLLHELVCNIAIYCTSGCGIFLLVHMRVHQDLLLTSSSLESCAYRPTEACLLHLLPLPPITPSYSLCRVRGPIWPLPALPPRQCPAFFQLWRGVHQHERRREEQSEGMFSPFSSVLHLYKLILLMPLHIVYFQYSNDHQHWY